MKIIIPKHFKAQNVEEFLISIEQIFSFNNKMLSNVRLDVSKLEKANVLNILLIYKIIDYSYNNYCFKKLELFANPSFMSKVEEFGFKSLFDAFMSNKDITEKEYKKLEIKTDLNLIIAPQALLRNSNFSSIFLREKFLPQIEKYYQNREKEINLIFTCFSEILLNFWEHAVNDTKSILVASGNNDRIEIACADTGNGLISTLKNCPEYCKFEEIDLIKKAFEKGVTSQRKSNHMGYGLWLIQKLVEINEGRLFVFSERYFFKNDFGKILTGKCGNWRGTIVYMSIPLKNCKTISDIPELRNEKSINSVLVNFK